LLVDVEFVEHEVGGAVGGDLDRDEVAFGGREARVLATTEDPPSGATGVFGNVLVERVNQTAFGGLN
jgi:hypothetical protein